MDYLCLTGDHQLHFSSNILVEYLNLVYLSVLSHWRKIVFSMNRLLKYGMIFFSSCIAEWRTGQLQEVKRKKIRLMLRLLCCIKLKNAFSLTFFEMFWVRLRLDIHNQRYRPEIGVKVIPQHIALDINFCRLVLWLQSDKYIVISGPLQGIMILRWAQNSLGLGRICRL